VTILTARRPVLMAALALMCVVGVAGQDARSASGESVERGRETFRQYCAACHGNGGRGDATGARALNPPPADLTTLSRRHGAFPAALVEATLKGTDQTKAHSSGMMVWKALFLADANGDEAVANARVGDVIAFIGSIQRKR
jgi:mono/diheme cytochrome c family protein